MRKLSQARERAFSKKRVYSTLHYRPKAESQTEFTLSTVVNFVCAYIFPRRHSIVTQISLQVYLVGLGRTIVGVTRLTEISLIS